MNAAVEQVLAFAAICLAAFWWSMDHTDDGIEPQCKRLADKRAWAARIDPGVRLAEREVAG